MSDDDVTFGTGSERGPVRIGDVTSPSITAVCPLCDRTEPMDTMPEAQAWLTGHIQTEHGEQLPDFGGVGDDV